MKALPNELILLDLISSKELANELEKLPENANVVRENNTLLIYF